MHVFPRRAALPANVAIGSSACGDSFEGAHAEQPAPGVQAPSGTGGSEPAKGPPVGGAAAKSDLTDALGVFVSPSGQDAADGTHVHPLATIQAGIGHAKAAGKRVFVCAGTYREALVIADSTSVIGGLDCTATEWRTGSGLSRVEAPSSPAIRATDLTSATRLEGLDIHAPDAAAPSGSSIGLLAYRASSLIVARTKIVAGHGKKGDDGADGVELVQSASANGESAIIAQSQRGRRRCGRLLGPWRHGRQRGGASVAAVLVESGITFDGSELAGGSGGDAGSVHSAASRRPGARPARTRPASDRSARSRAVAVAPREPAATAAPVRRPPSCTRA